MWCIKWRLMFKDFIKTLKWLESHLIFQVKISKLDIYCGYWGNLHISHIYSNCSCFTCSRGAFNFLLLIDVQPLVMLQPCSNKQQMPSFPLYIIMWVHQQVMWYCFSKIIFRMKNFLKENKFPSDHHLWLLSSVSE